jgi:hypothetical protein
VALSDDYHDSAGPATNFGLALGLQPKRSLFPLLIGLVVGGTGLLMSLRQRPNRSWPAEIRRSAPTGVQPAN